MREVHLKALGRYVLNSLINLTEQLKLSSEVMNRYKEQSLGLSKEGAQERCPAN